jgi:hypothetical protein
MMLDVLAAVTRKDEPRWKKQVSGAAEGKYRDRKKDVKRNAGIAAVLKARESWFSILGCNGL